MDAKVCWTHPWMAEQPRRVGRMRYDRSFVGAGRWLYLLSPGASLTAEYI